MGVRRVDPDPVVHRYSLSCHDLVVGNSVLGWNRITLERKILREAQKALISAEPFDQNALRIFIFFLQKVNTNVINSFTFAVGCVPRTHHLVGVITCLTVGRGITHYSSHAHPSILSGHNEASDLSEGIGFRPKLLQSVDRYFHQLSPLFLRVLHAQHRRVSRLPPGKIASCLFAH